MKKLLFVIMITLALFNVNAEPINPADYMKVIVNCTLPTEREADSNGIVLPLPLNEIGSVQLYWGYNPGDPIRDEIKQIKQNSTCNFNFDVLVYAGKDIYYVITTKDIDGRESLYSAERKFEVLAELMPPKQVTSITETLIPRQQQ